MSSFIQFLYIFYLQLSKNAVFLSVSESFLCFSLSLFFFFLYCRNVCDHCCFPGKIQSFASICIFWIGLLLWVLPVLNGRNFTFVDFCWEFICCLSQNRDHITSSVCSISSSIFLHHTGSLWCILYFSNFKIVIFLSFRILPSVSNRKSGLLLWCASFVPLLLMGCSLFQQNWLWFSLLGMKKNSKLYWFSDFLLSVLASGLSCFCSYLPQFG